MVGVWSQLAFALNIAVINRNPWLESKGGNNAFVANNCQKRMQKCQKENVTLDAVEIRLKYVVVLGGTVSTALGFNRINQQHFFARGHAELKADS